MQSIKQPKYILFDVGNVLMYKVTHEDENVGKLLGMTRSEYRKFLDQIIEEQTPEEHKEFRDINTVEKEKIYLDKLHRKMCKILGINPQDSFIEQMTDFRMKGDFALFDGIPHSLKLLCTKYHLGILSNALPSRREYELKIDNIDGYFENIFISHEIGIEKPDPKAFKYVLNHIDYDSKDVMFVDDREECLEGAREAGITNLILIKDKNIEKQYTTFKSVTELTSYLI